ncbi:MAG: hypothetical protein BWY08_01420 [Bacteroidetes bacterium ADurb.Bin174]|jgi:hypothetical protein|nr:MAG: hypothetical protein BWY08_01420 [Bacteroidetes bacterium ADurb.Bin174]
MFEFDCFHGLLLRIYLSMDGYAKQNRSEYILLLVFNVITYNYFYKNLSSFHGFAIDSVIYKGIPYLLLSERNLCFPYAKVNFFMI